MQDVDVTAEQRRRPAAHPVVGDEVEAGVELAAEREETELVVAADPGARDRHLTRVLDREVEHVLEGLELAVGAHPVDLGWSLLADDESDVVHEGVRLRSDRVVDDLVRDYGRDDVAVGGLAEHLPKSDLARGAGDVVEDDLLPHELLGAQRDVAGVVVGATALAEPDQHLDRSVGVVTRLRDHLL